MKEKSLNNDDFLEIKKYCKKKKILFFLSPNDKKALYFTEKMDLPLLKIVLVEVQNHSFITFRFTSSDLVG